MGNIMKPTFVFDCDGVILKSNHLKSEAFRAALEEEPSNLVDRFITYHQNTGGVSRFKKFEHFYTKINPVVLPEKATAEAVTRYANIVREKLLTCDAIPGVIDYLKSIQGQGEIYVVSGGAEDELREVFHQRGLSSYFTEIYGSPKDKRTILSLLNNQNKLIKPAYYFGDAKLDMEMAAEFNFAFVFVSGHSEWTEAKLNPDITSGAVIPDFSPQNLSELA